MSLQLPPIPQPVDYQLPGSERLNQEQATEFKTKITALYEALAKSIPANAVGSQQKLAQLQEINGHIFKFNNIFSGPTLQISAAFQAKIQAEIKAVRDEFQTNSHWLQMTVHRTQFVEMEPTIDKTPELKIDPYKVATSLTFVDSLQRPYEKLRALERFKKEITKELRSVRGQITEAAEEKALAPLKAKKEALKKSMKLVQHYAVYKISRKEKFLALKQVSWIDKDTKQSEKLKKMVDPKGEEEITYLLENVRGVEELSSALGELLKSSSSPDQMPLSILLKWPKHKLKLTEAEQETRIKGLFLLQSLVDDPCRLLIIDYLNNLIDPTGSMRFKYIAQAGMPAGKTCFSLAEVAMSMRRFNLTGTAPLEIQFPALTKLGADLALPAQFLDKKLKPKEITPFAHAFKAEAASHFLQFDLATYLKKPKEFQKLYQPLNDFYAAFKGYFREMSKTNPSPILLHNVTLLAAKLAFVGEFNLSCVLYLLLNQEGAPHTKLPEYIQLKQLFSPFNKNKNYHEFLAERREQGELCNPWLSSVHSAIDLLGEKLFLHKGSQINSLKEALGDKFLPLCKSLTDKKVVDWDEWADNHLFDDMVLLLSKIGSLKLAAETHDSCKSELEKFMQDQMLVLLKIEKLKWDLQTNHYAFQLYYKAYKRPPAMQKVVDAIKRSPVDD